MAANKHRVFLAIQFGIFVLVMDTAATVIALPTLALALATDLPTVQWVVVGNGLAIAALLVPMGRLGDTLGRKTLYVTGFGLFVAGALLAANAPSVGVLICARIVAGIGVAMTQGNSLAILAHVFGEGQRGRILGIQIGVVGVAGILGPAIGGFIVEAFGWRKLFYASAALGLLAMLVVQWTLARRAHRSPATAHGFDWLGAGLSALFLLCLLLTLSLGSQRGWTSPGIVGAGVLSAALLGLFIRREQRVAAPMVDLSLFRNPYFAIGTTGSVFTYMGMTCMRFLLPFHLQAVQGYSPAQVGLIVMPSALATAVAGPMMGRAADRLGGRVVANSGLTLGVLSLLALSRLNPDSPLWFVILATVLMTTAAATFQASNSSSILDSVEKRHYGVVAGFINLSRNTGNVLGVAAATAIVVAMMQAQGFAPEVAAVTESGRAGHLAFSAGASNAFVLHAVLLGMLLLAAIKVMPKRIG